MAYGSVHIPVGCTVSVGDTTGTLVNMGVLKGDASIEIKYDRVKVQGNKAEALVDYIKNMVATASFTLYQLFLNNLQELLDGVSTVTPAAGAPVVDHHQYIAPSTWAYLDFMPFENQQAAGTVPTGITLTGSIDGLLTVDSDYFVIKENGIWGLYVKDTVPVTTLVQQLDMKYSYTPAASITFKMGAASATLTPKIVQFSKTINGLVYRARLWSAVNEGGFSLAFPDSASDDPASMAITLSGAIDTTRASGDQLIEIYDELGLTL